MSDNHSPPDDLDREAFYTADLDEDDGDDYELEPVDPAILESERQRTEAAMIRAQTGADIDRLDEASQNAPRLDDPSEGLSFRFQTKHLLMATAGLALLLSMGKLLKSNFAALILVTVVLLLAAHAYLGWRDRQRLEELAEKRRKLMELDRARATQDTDAEQAALEELDEDEQSLREAAKPAPLKFAFSMKQLLVAITASAIALGILSLIGAPILAGVLGLLAIVGLVIFAIGVEVPAVVMLGWWVVLVLYILVSIIGQLLPSGAPGP